MIEIFGIVQKGNQRGVQLGFPTANVLLASEKAEKLEPGIYRGEVIFENNRYKAALYVPAARNIIEAHLLDFSGDLYGREITINVLEKIRDSQQFSSESELRVAIQKDVESVYNA